MLKILLVEDLVEKKAEIVKILNGKLGENNFHILYATDAFEARKYLSNHYFDFVILDLNIPRRSSNGVESNVGIELIQFIESNPKAIPPKFVACLTAYNVDPEFVKSYPLCHFIHYSPDSDWKDHINKLCIYLNRTHVLPLRNDKITYHYDIMIMTAIDEEFNAVKNFLKVSQEWNTLRVNGDDQKYTTNIINTTHGFFSVVLTQSSQMGMAAAAVAASKAIEYFCPKLVVMSGICAGVKTKTNFGDIIIADPSFDSGSGKWKVDNDGDLIFHPAHYHLRIETEIKRICQEISEDVDIRKSIFAGFTLPETRPTAFPQVLIEANASGGSVLQSTVKMEEIVQAHKNLIGLEMEAYAVYLAATNARNPKPKFFSAKSVCDFGTEEKGDAVHTYAAYTSVAFINEFITKADFLVTD
ncbi:phosphorylase [Acinetobacter seifertii]|uniref:phosphorylase family protein n=1 Tax=Acinetobacter seifertii TaxID=1530123 RepID=UPI0029408087|nr:phosphorylase [Acinetobacter seifertii]MDV4262644.1 phosphorylase [Acinetobacter seifertii]